jgi:uracil-DNA glycosylase
MSLPDPLSRDAPADLVERIGACRLCANRFAATATAHVPRPVVWFRPGARLLIAGQAPGARVHLSGRPFTDASGDRLRAWLGMGCDEFYDLSRVAVVPMAFCFPGYDDKGSDLPPPALCAATWRVQVLSAMPGLQLTVLAGGAAMRWHLGTRSVQGTVADWRNWAKQGVFALPHPSWRNTGWLARNAWFETDLLPELQARVRAVMETPI